MRKFKCVACGQTTTVDYGTRQRGRDLKCPDCGGRMCREDSISGGAGAQRGLGQRRGNGLGRANASGAGSGGGGMGRGGCVGGRGPGRGGQCGGRRAI